MSAHLGPGWDELGPVARREALAHAAGCADCRIAMLAEDPTRVFAFLGEAPIPVSVLDEVSDAVRRAIVESSPVPRWSLQGLGWLRPAAAWAAAAGLAAALLLAPTPDLHRARTTTTTTTTAAVAGGKVEMIGAPPSARVVDMTVGDTQVVMIFDEGLAL